MAINEQDKITVPFASSGLRNDIPETATGSNLASMQEGFPAITMTDIASGGQPPDGKDFNGILNVITKILQYAQSGGLYKYDSDYATAMGGYPIGAILRSADGDKIWMNTTANNSSDPDNGGQNWVELTNASSLASAISSVEGLISAEATARANAVSAEATARANADSALQTGKQDKLTFDSTPTTGSTNPVTSGGIKTAIDNIDALPSQTGNAGKVLGTNGTSASWITVPSDDTKLDKSGGTMAGSINSSVTSSLLRSTNDSYLGLSGGNGVWDSSGANLFLYGRSHDAGGQYRLRAVDENNNQKVLIGYPDGRLQLAGKNILREDTLCTTKATTTNPASASNPCVVVETYKNGTEWYRIWSDGWIEQGGYVSNASGSVEKTVTLKKAFTTTGYCVINQFEGNTTGIAGAAYNNIIGTRETGSFKMRLDNRSGLWYACGY